LYIVGGNVNYYSHYGKQHRVFSRNKKQNSHMISLPKLPAIPLLSMYPKETKSISKSTCAPMFVASLLIIAKI
jgi:hypothetical protein